MLEVRGLVKRYGAVKAVDGVSFKVGPGESVGLLGPNGAGKTTTLSMVVGLLQPDGGEVLLEGRALRGDTDPLKRTLGFVPQELALYEELPARANLRLFGALQGVTGAALDEAVESALALVSLSDRAGDKAGTFSGGMKRRLNLAAALLHGPRVLLLDEPTVGVDPQSRNAIFDNLEALRARGIALVYTTHYMEEVERLCDRVIIIDRGQVVADDTLRGLHRRQAGACAMTLELEAPGSGPWLEDLRALPGVQRAELHEDLQLQLTLADLGADAPRVLAWLQSQGRRYTHLVTERPNLESLFLGLTGRSLRDS
ncbi:ABC transporter ATP-binding protein [Aggregicoccus sp. 17bor-14]|uniref:ABC transporter ATP-binding protein n=1 Tax=Myxococcaceae TaxID=31 RepID=UPI00129CBDDB|nr:MULTISPECIES: ABC transporter ATP-binding protein [Myxococcaceae]MBF5045177.1 ABC transporter ATP-binding protein [Simulacricoccus sp. 17bor-14]MRI90918.1 ABC transporter ATP-binding protein [Aggregicoccus sp. 17bor-14]